MRLEQVIDIEAPRDAVWPILADVERWPGWTPTVKSARLTSPGPLAPGSAVELDVSGVGRATWVISEWTPGSSFTWSASGPGWRSTADHRLIATGDSTRAVLAVDVTGPAALLSRPIVRRRSLRNLQLEADGLKRAAERSTGLAGSAQAALSGAS